METLQLIKAAKGNPGALTALIKMAEMGYGNTAKAVIELGITGTDIYVLWSDLCGQDPRKVAKLLSTCPEPIIKEAASRQDYSGRTLVAEYLK